MLKKKYAQTDPAAACAASCSSLAAFCDSRKVNTRQSFTQSTHINIDQLRLDDGSLVDVDIFLQQLRPQRVQSVAKLRVLVYSMQL